MMWWRMRITTFSIIAFDRETNALGVAVASKFLAAGSIVPWAQAGTGAVATQALANYNFGPQGLALMAEGKSAAEALAELLEQDDQPEHRQVALIDSQGRAAAHTGSACLEFAGHLTGDGFSCQGNILAGAHVLDAMASGFLAARGELADRLVEALRAGETAGGDRRGKQSAAVVVVTPGGGYGGNNDRYLDLRVDDDPEPVEKLARLVQMHHVFFGRSQTRELTPIDSQLARELQAIMHAQGLLKRQPDGNWDDESRLAFQHFISIENLEERWNIEQHPYALDRVALEYLRQRFPTK